MGLFTVGSVLKINDNKKNNEHHNNKTYTVYYTSHAVYHKYRGRRRERINTRRDVGGKTLLYP